MFIINKEVMADMPIASTVYNILWNGLQAREGFEGIEEVLV
ncbi:MAG: glycerol-3-phosphate dehydrogenase, partial [Gloeobacteraceae cyanobacterium ES-bin-316]|nr:glycerol-3-phosphate dehydrogenase [Ferruginibacter sp.]